MRGEGGSVVGYAEQRTINDRGAIARFWGAGEKIIYDHVVLDSFSELGFFSGFLAFLAAGFAYVPAELMLLIEFGVVAIVAIGLIRALRR